MTVGLLQGCIDSETKTSISFNDIHTHAEDSGYLGPVVQRRKVTNYIRGRKIH
jgi:uncharacterized membrane protein YvbJ